jgi:serine/threonine-protein kinase
MTNFEEQLHNAFSQTYDIERELGGGGMSRVFVATDKALGRKVVIKLLSPELTADVNRGRFRREIQVAAQLQHPHIVTLFSAGEDGDLVYYTMPFIKGESLKSELEKNGPMPVTQVVRILYDVVDALAYAHENGVVHRDIKPANILKSGLHSLVTDFGVAKALNAAMPSGGMTSTGMAIGTPAYMSPEQLAGDPAANHRIDIYAVGLLAYELLTGTSPFAAATPRGVLAAVLTRDPQPLSEVRPDVPARLSEMVMACLSKEPDGRPQSAEAVMEALDMFSTASGEIRTREYKVHKPESSSPVATAAAPSAVTGESALSGSTPVTSDISIGGTVLQQVIQPTDGTAQDQTATSDGVPPKKSRTMMWLGVAAAIVVVAVGGIFMSQGGGDNAVTAIAPAVIAPVADSSMQQPALPAATPVTAAAPAAAVVDSQALRDSARARAAAAAAKRAAIPVKVDSTKQMLDQARVVRGSRWAASAMLADAAAHKKFLDGATHSGGILGTKRLGDLQTQIDALQPFLAKNGLTYDQFKHAVQDSGFRIYDEFGRMVPDSLQRFASVVN